MAPSFSRCSSALLMVAMCVASAAALSTTAEERNAALFASFKSRFNKTYPGAAAEATRYEIFVANLARAAEHGKANPKAKFGVNAYSDLTEEEFRRTHHNAAPRFKDMMARRPAVAPLFTQEQVSAAATSIDWRTKGAVTYVKNQLNCGGCYSFSTTGNIEGQWFLAGNPLVALSEQEIISCDTLDDGCGGGTMDTAMTWLVQNQNGNIATEASYPFVSGSGTAPACALPKTTGATITGHIDLPQNEDQMATWLSTKGPISIAVDATSFQTYNGGILTNCISKQLDHAILAVGYNDVASTPYWIVKNSWGTSWGEDGYIYIAKGSNQCLIDSAPSSSVVGGPAPASSGSAPSPASSGSGPAPASSGSQAASSSSSF
eukprot:TRINITY_DN3373_c0_g2_i2.p1 TRINITY_DN3373_c0_g2~~TRINITY_DN3373_c0_g2_i2.p1  ORF type:complete len:376 (+),score=88.76 TRINITY_DN3373_c0_g2_i2:59-1186(+)